jgi:hypothetical protein
MFGMKEATSCRVVYCNSLIDLTKTLRCLMAKGFRVRKPATWGRKFNQSKVWESANLFGNKTFEAKEIKTVPVVSNTLDYTNGWGYKHTIKLTEADFEQAN